MPEDPSLGLLKRSQALAVARVHQLRQLGRDDPVDGDTLADRVALDQHDRLDHGRVHGVRGPELPHLDDLDEPGPVMAGVGGFEDCSRR